MKSKTRLRPCHAVLSRQSLASAEASRGGGFTLIELMVVIGIVVVLTVLIAPAFNAIKGSRDIGTAASDIASVLEGARSFAIANNTYTWVGVFEDDPTAASAKPANSGTGRVVMSAVASTDGTRIYNFIASATALNSTAPPPLDSAASGTGRLIQLGKVVKVSGIHMVADFAGFSLPALAGTTVKPAYQLGNSDFARHPVPPSSSMVANPTTFSYPIGSTSPDYTFVKIIEFNPRGEAYKIVSDLDGPIPLLGVGFQPARGNFADTKAANVAVVIVSGLTGATRLYRR